MKITPMSVQLIDHMGTDLSVVNAARVSMAKESDWQWLSPDQEILPERDEKLIKYLSDNNHWTPFGHAFATFRIKAPIFVVRQLVKHQVGLCWNEVSRRYVDEEPEFWFPEFGWRSRPDGSIKQGSGGIHANSSYWDLELFAAIENAAATYVAMINDGVAPEQARMILPLNTHTEWIWSGSLAAWGRVCKLRIDPHAQQETREIAEKISYEMTRLFPVSWSALMS
jgi:thymidylate synthase (FAD)